MKMGLIFLNGSDSVTNLVNEIDHSILVKVMKSFLENMRAVPKERSKPL